MSKVKLNEIDYFVFDLDGTLLTSKHEVSPSSLKEIEYLKNNNKKIFLASGRAYYMFLNLIKKLEMKTEVVSCNGAITYDPNKKTVIDYCAISKDSAKQIFKILVDHKATFVAYSTNQMFSYQYNKESKWINWLKETNDKLSADEKFIVEPILEPNNFDFDQYSIIKFLVIYNEIEKNQTDKILETLKEINGVYLVRSQEGIFDVMPNGFNKGSALKMLENKKMLNLNKTIVFGDADNDISMFEQAKYSVAMKQAKDEVKNRAIFVTDSNDNDGIAKFLEFLKEMKK